MNCINTLITYTRTRSYTFGHGHGYEHGFAHKPQDYELFHSIITMWWTPRNEDDDVDVDNDHDNNGNNK